MDVWTGEGAATLRAGESGGGSEDTMCMDTGDDEGGRGDRCKLSLGVMG